MIEILWSFIASTFTLLWEATGMALSLTFFRNRNDYTARFSNDQGVLSRLNKGYNLCGLRLSSEASARSILIAGSSGSGKSSIAYFNELLAHDEKCNYILHDPSKEYYPKICAYFQSRGYRILIWDPSNIHGMRFNPLRALKNDTDIAWLAGIIMRCSYGKKAEYWELSAQQLIKNTISLALAIPGYDDMANVCRLIQMSGYSNNTRFKEIVAKHASEQTFQEVKAFLSNEERVLKSIISTALSALNAFQLDSVSRLTSGECVDIGRELRSHKTLLIIQNQVQNMQTFNVVNSIFFSCLFRQLLSELPSANQSPIRVCLDEAFSGLVIPDLADVIAHVRKYKINIILGTQEISQIEHTYSKEVAQTIIGQCHTKLFLTGMSEITGSYVESLLGKYSYWEDGQKHVRPLKTSDELRQIPKDKGVLICGSYRPVYADLKPYYLDKTLLKRSQMPMPHIQAIAAPSVNFIS